MRFDEFVKNASFALSEGSVYERLRRHPSIEFDPYIFHASLIYDEKRNKSLREFIVNILMLVKNTNCPSLS